MSPTTPLTSAAEDSPIMAVSLTAAVPSNTATTTTEPELSTTASPPTAEATQEETPSARAEDAEIAQVDPKIAQLKAMFPDITEDVLEAVLEAHGGSVEQASELLLSMNDPTPEQPSADEQFARALQEEEQEHARRERAAARQSRSREAESGGAASTTGLQYQAYVPRRRGQAGGAGNAALSREGGAQPQQGGPREKDELDQLTEQFSKIAEQGKKTFGTLFGMAKEQIGKLNESISAPSGSGSASDSAPAPPPKNESSASWTPPSALPRPRATQQAAPSAVPELLPRPSPTPRDTAVPVSTSAAAAPSTDRAVEAPAQPEQPKTDFTKYGLLPRQSVSLLDNKKSDSDSDEDDLEYTRNPFDRDD